MATAIPLGFEASELERAIEKRRRDELVTPREREVLIARGLELANLTDEVPEGAVLDDDEDDPELEDELLMDDAVADAHPEDCVSWEQYCAERGIARIPRAAE